MLDHGAIATDDDLMAGLGHFQRHGRAAYDIAEALLDWGLPVDGRVAGDRTPLQAFAHQAAHKTVSWLIAHGADIGGTRPGWPDGSPSSCREKHAPDHSGNPR